MTPVAARATGFDVARVRADFPQMNSLIAYLTENCCAGAGCDASACDPPALSDRSC